MKILQAPESKILLLLFVMAVASHWLLPEPGYKREIKETRKLYQDSVSHFRTLYIGAMKAANKAKIAQKEAELRTIAAEKERDEANRKRKVQQKEYEKALRDFIRYTPVALDSAVSRRYGYTR